MAKTRSQKGLDYSKKILKTTKTNNKNTKKQIAKNKRRNDQQNIRKKKQNNFEILNSSEDLDDISNLVSARKDNDIYSNEKNKNAQQNLDMKEKQIREIDDCPICYINLENLSETFKCQTCNKLYHGSCLEEWFLRKEQMLCPCCNCEPFK